MSKRLKSRLWKVCTELGANSTAKVFAAFQQRWLEQQRAHYTAVRWRGHRPGEPFWSVAFTGASGTGTERWALFHSEQGAVKAEGYATAFALDGAQGVGSGGGAQLSAGRGGVVALGADASERVVVVALRAVSRGQTVRAAGARVAAGSSCAQVCAGSGDRNGFHLSQSPAEGSCSHKTHRAFSHLPGPALQRAAATL
jgi:hypothetical protein